MGNGKERESDSVDSQAIPQRTLFTGKKMPALGLGTFGSDYVPPALVAQATRSAAEVGYRHFDCAPVYGNRPEVGVALEEVQHTWLRHEDLWTTSKLWNDKLWEDDMFASCRKPLADLRVECLNLYLVRLPFPNFHPASRDVSACSAEAKPYIHANCIKTRQQDELILKVRMPRDRLSNLGVTLKMELNTT